VSNNNCLAMLWWKRHFHCYEKND